MRHSFAGMLLISSILAFAPFTGAQTRPTTAPRPRPVVVYTPAPSYGYAYDSGFSTTGHIVAAYYAPTYSVTPSYYTSSASFAIAAPIDQTTYGWSDRLWNANGYCARSRCRSSGGELVDPQRTFETFR